MRGGFAAGPQQQSGQQRSLRLSEGWKLATAGTANRLGAIDNQLLGCTSVELAQNGGGGITAKVVAMAFLPDWGVTLFRVGAPKTKEELIEMLDQEAVAASAITKVAMDAMETEAR